MEFVRLSVDDMDENFLTAYKKLARSSSVRREQVVHGWARIACI